MGNNLEVRTHHPCCTNQPWNGCKCVPPASRVEGGSTPEYRCNPSGPLKRWPPVLSRHLVHSIKSPSCVHKDDKTVLQKIPRRICGEIRAENDQEAEGWGIYYEEGPNLLWVAVLTTLVGINHSSAFWHSVGHAQERSAGCIWSQWICWHRVRSGCAIARLVPKFMISTLINVLVLKLDISSSRGMSRLSHAAVCLIPLHIIRSSKIPRVGYMLLVSSRPQKQLKPST